jgi:hypothetical protein
MKIRKEILVKHLTNAAIDQISFDYQKNGYEMTKEVYFGDIRADLVARKGNELIVFEFKYADWTKDKVDTIKKLRNIVVREHGTGFKLVLVNPLEGISVKVDDLEQILFDLVIKNPDLYDEIVTHKEVRYISDVNLNEVTIHKEEIELLGSAVVNMILQYGSDEDIAKGRDLSIDESFLLDFHISFGWDFEVKEIHKFNLDTSDYYDYQDAGSLQVASKS